MKPPRLRTRAYRQLWRVVAGAIGDALAQHPEYLTEAGRRSAARSITKRVTGAVMGYAIEASASAARGRSGASPAADEAVGGHHAGRDATVLPDGSEAAGSARGLAAFLPSPILARMRAAIGWRR